MILRCFHVFYGSLQQNLHHLHMYSGVPHVNRGDTPESGWIHLKVSIQCVIFSVGTFQECKSGTSNQSIYVELTLNPSCTKSLRFSSIALIS